jgi:hypothetical protein
MRVRTGALALLFVVASFAGATDHGWLSAKTEHFTFIYRPEHQSAVDELAAFAEDVYDDVCRLFGSTPAHVPVVLYGETDLANGYYSPAPPQHVGLYLPQPTLPFLGARSESWLRGLLVHELTHFVQANFDRGLFHLTGTLFGRTLTGLSLGLVPLWHTEGLAINTETVFTAGGRGRDPFFEMTYKAPVVEDRLFSLFQAGYESHLAPRGRYYTAGYFIWDYLQREFGQEYVVDLSTAVARFPLFGIWGPIRRTTGSRMRDLYDTIEADLIRRYADDARIDPARRLTPEVRSDYYLPTQTSRGLHLYRIRPDRPPAVVILDPESGTERAVLTMRLTDEASWSVTADGSVIAFATPEIDYSFPDEPAIRSNLHILDTDSGQITPLTAGGGYHQPAISPDGSFLVAVRRDEGYQRLVRFELGDHETAEVRERGGAPDDHPREISLVEGDRIRFYTPTVSPDGATIAVAANQRGLQQIMLVDAARGNYTLLPHPEGGVPYFPSFADDDTLLYGSDRGGALALYRHSLANDEVVRVATDPVGAFAGELVGDRLLVSVYTADGYAVRTAVVPEGGEHSAAAVPVSAPRPLEEIDPPPAVTGASYTSFPSPAFWLPMPGLAGPGFDPSGLGVGALVYGADYLSRHAWQTSLVYFPALAQLDYAIAWQTTYGRTGFSVAADSAYSVFDAGEGERVHAKVLSHGGTLTRTFVSRYRLGVSSALAGRVGLTHSLVYLSPQRFPVTGALTGDVPLELNRFVAGADIFAARTPLSSQRASVAPGGLRGSLSVAVPFDAPSFSPGSLLTAFEGSANLGVGRSDHVVSFAPRITFSTNPAFASPVDLRGFASRTVHAGEDRRGSFGLDVDYRAPRLLVDLPLAPSVGITAFGFGLFAETTGVYDPAPATVVFDPAIGLGAELTTVFTYLAPLPVTLGVAFRVEPTDPGAFSLLRDVTIYVESDLIESIPRLPQYLVPE